MVLFGLLPALCLFPRCPSLDELLCGAPGCVPLCCSFPRSCLGGVLCVHGGWCSCLVFLPWCHLCSWPCSSLGTCKKTCKIPASVFQKSCNSLFFKWLSWWANTTIGNEAFCIVLLPFAPLMAGDYLIIILLCFAWLLLFSCFCPFLCVMADTRQAVGVSCCPGGDGCCAPLAFPPVGVLVVPAGSRPASSRLVSLASACLVPVLLLCPP